MMVSNIHRRFNPADVRRWQKAVIAGLVIAVQRSDAGRVVVLGKVRR